MTDAVREALEAARDAARRIDPAFDVLFPDECSRDDGEAAACDAFVAAIAAFLRALPLLIRTSDGRVIDPGDPDQLAAAVEQAAKERSP